MLTVVADQLPEAERWLADLQSVVGEAFVALYPPREGFGEVEPHAEVAGERVETLERMTRGEVRVLLTTARAVLERTRLPKALAAARLELRRGDRLAARRRSRRISRRWGSSGCGMVEDVAQFCGARRHRRRVRLRDDRAGTARVLERRDRRTAPLRPPDAAHVEAGGPRARPSGRRERRHATRRSDSSARRSPRSSRRRRSSSCRDGVHLEPEMRRTWDEAAHHIDLARRRGEDAAPRDELYQPPGEARGVARRIPVARDRRVRRRRRGRRVPAARPGSDRPRHEPPRRARSRRRADDHPVRQRGAGRAPRRAARDAPRRNPAPPRSRSACSAAAS